MIAVTLSLALMPLAPSPAAPRSLAALDKTLDAVCARFHGRMGYHLRLLKDGREIGYRADEIFPTASTIKTAVMVEMMRQVDAGKLRWTDKRPVPPPPGRQSSMWSFFFRDDVSLDMDGWTNLMIGVSDNTATLVLRDVLGFKAVNDSMTALGLPNTKLLSGTKESDGTIFRLRRMYGLGMTTPREMTRLLTLIAEGKAASPGACDKMLRILSRQYWDDYIGASVPPDVRVASKSGAINRSRSDTAIVFADHPYVLCIYTDSQKDQRWTAENEGEIALQRVAREVWSTLHPHRPYSAPKGADKFPSTGGGV